MGVLTGSCWPGSGRRVCAQTTHRLEGKGPLSCPPRGRRLFPASLTRRPSHPAARVRDAGGPRPGALGVRGARPGAAGRRPRRAGGPGGPGHRLRRRAAAGQAARRVRRRGGGRAAGEAAGAGAGARWRGSPAPHYSFHGWEVPVARYGGAVLPHCLLAHRPYGCAYLFRCPRGVLFPPRTPW
jgi:hypothetical protein